jgi:D-citramalate synthase
MLLIIKIANFMINYTNNIKILDTTLQDGEQTPSISLTAREKLNIAKCLLTEVKVDLIEAGSAIVSEGEKKNITKICRWVEREGLLDKIEVLGFVDKTGRLTG